MVLVTNFYFDGARSTSGIRHRVLGESTRRVLPQQWFRITPYPGVPVARAAPHIKGEHDVSTKGLVANPVVALETHLEPNDAAEAAGLVV